MNDGDFEIGREADNRQKIIVGVERVERYLVEFDPIGFQFRGFSRRVDWYPTLSVVVFNPCMKRHHRSCGGLIGDESNRDACRDLRGAKGCCQDDAVIDGMPFSRDEDFFGGANRFVKRYHRQSFCDSIANGVGFGGLGIAHAQPLCFEKQSSQQLDLWITRGDYWG